MSMKADAARMLVDISVDEAHKKCAKQDPELWFSDDEASVRKAKSICAGCPVRPICLEVALVNREREGVWGGLDPKERTRIVRERNRQQRKLAAKRAAREAAETFNLPLTDDEALILSYA